VAGQPITRQREAEKRSKELAKLPPPIPPRPLKGKAAVLAKMPRASELTPELAETILQAIAEGETLSKICKSPPMPSPGIVAKWARAETEFGGAFKAACEVGALVLFHQLIDITRGGKSGDDHIRIQRDRLYSDSLRWAIGKLWPQKFSDNKHEITGANGGPVELKVSFLSEAEAKARGWA
jgi:hypothetical protein